MYDKDETFFRSPVSVRSLDYVVRTLSYSFVDCPTRVQVKMGRKDHFPCRVHVHILPSPSSHDFRRPLCRYPHFVLPRILRRRVVSPVTGGPFDLDLRLGLGVRFNDSDSSSILVGIVDRRIVYTSNVCRSSPGPIPFQRFPWGPVPLSPVVFSASRHGPLDQSVETHGLSLLEQRVHSGSKVRTFGLCLFLRDSWDVPTS